MIDFHCHLLPNLDDGPSHIDESVAMAAALRKSGFKTIYCTPHLITGSFDADNEAVLSSVSDLQTRLNKENIELEILPGREYYMDEFLVSYLKDPLPLAKTHYILIEISRNAPVEFIKETCLYIKNSGFIPMIAHPERCSIFAMPRKNTTSRLWFSVSKHKTSDSKAEEPSLIDYLKDIGCAFQGNLGSFDDWYGPEVKQLANYLRKKEVFTHYGTDAHSLRGITRLTIPISPLTGG